MGERLNMTAREMFENLGFNYGKNENSIFYQKHFGEIVDISIHFYKEDKRVVFGGIRRNFWVIKYELLKAIHNQLIELGWLDE